MSSALFPTITPDIVRRRLAAARAEGNAAVAQIRAAVAAKFPGSKGGPKHAQLADITPAPCSRGAGTSATSIYESGGECPDKRAKEIGSPNLHSGSPYPFGSNSQMPERNRAPGPLSPSFPAAGSLAGVRSAGDRREGTLRFLAIGSAEASGGGSLSSIWASPECREPDRLLCGAQRSDCLADRIILNGTDGRSGKTLSCSGLQDPEQPMPQPAGLGSERAGPGTSLSEVVA